MLKSNRGGRGQGRKPVSPGGSTIGVTMRVTHAQKEKLALLGGAAWLRRQIDMADCTKIAPETS